MLSKNFEYTGQRLYWSKIVRADQIGTPFGDGVTEQELFAFEQTKAESFVPNATFVGRFGRAAEPAFIDSAAIGSESVVVARMQFDPSSRMQERAGNPSGCQAQQSARGIDGRIQNGGDTVTLNQPFIQLHSAHESGYFV